VTPARPSPLEFIYFGGGVVRCRDVSWVEARPVEKTQRGTFDGVYLELVMTTGQRFAEELPTERTLALERVCALFDRLRATSDHQQLAECLLDNLKIYRAQR